MRLPMRRLVVAATAAIRTGVPWAAGLCSGAVLAASPFGGAAAPVGDTALDGVRGGFTSPDGGLHVTFGVTRAVYIDGTLASTTSDAGSGALVQRGAGNLVAGVDAVGPALVVQNTLNNQKIQTVTTIDVTTNGLSLSRGLALQSTVGAGIAASLRR